MKRMKSKHFHKYLYLLQYDDPKDISYKTLAGFLGVHQNLIIALFGSAQRNHTIYQELRRMGYADYQIPRWFASPPPPTRSAAADAETSIAPPPTPAEI